MKCYLPFRNGPAFESRYVKGDACGCGGCGKQYRLDGKSINCGKNIAWFFKLSLNDIGGESENVLAIGINRLATDLVWHKISSILNDDFELELVIVLA